jgi:hypothetical protein
MSHVDSVGHTSTGQQVLGSTLRLLALTKASSLRGNRSFASHFLQQYWREQPTNDRLRDALALMDRHARLAERWKASQRIAKCHGRHFQRREPLGTLGHDDGSRLVPSPAGRERAAIAAQLRHGLLETAADGCRSALLPLGPKGAAHALRLRHVAKGMGQQSSNATGSLMAGFGPTRTEGSAQASVAHCESADLSAEDGRSGKPQIVPAESARESFVCRLWGGGAGQPPERTGGLRRAFGNWWRSPTIGHPPSGSSARQTTPRAPTAPEGLR